MNNSMLWLVLVLLLLAAGLLVGSMYFRRRARALSEGAAPAVERSASRPAPAAAEDIEVAIPVEFQLATANGAAPVLRATALAADAFALATTRAQPLNTRSGGVSRLAPILKAVRLHAEGAEPGAPQYLQVALDCTLARGATGQCFRAFVLDSGGRPIEHHRLQDAGRLSFGFGGTLLVQAISVLLAQKHLKDIHAQLGAITRGIAQVQPCLERERQREVLAIIDEMAQRVLELEAGVLDERWPSQLHATDQALARIQAHVREEIQSTVAVLQDLTTGFWGAAEKRQAHIEGSNQQLERSVVEWQLAIEARVLGWKMLVALPGANEPKVERRRAIEREIALLHADDGLLAQFDAGLREQIGKIQRLLRKSDASRRRGLLTAQREDRRAQWRQQHDGLLGGMTAVAGAAATGPDGALHLALKLEGPDIVEAWELPAVVPVNTALAAGPESAAAVESPDVVVEPAALTADSAPETSADAPQEVAPLAADAQACEPRFADAPEPAPLADEPPDRAPMAEPADQAVQVEAPAIEVEKRAS